MEFLDLLHFLSTHIVIIGMSNIDDHCGSGSGGFTDAEMDKVAAVIMKVSMTVAVKVAVAVRL